MRAVLPNHQRPMGSPTSLTPPHSSACLAAERGAGDAPWHVPDNVPKLKCDEIHLWRASLDANRHALTALEHTLTADELAKAGRFRFELDRDRYILAHGALRTILARYVTATPRELAFRCGAQGKPELASGVVHFSLSHSHDLFVCAIGHTPSLGVDVERVRPGVAEAVGGFLSPRARRALEALPQRARRQAFFQGWTRLEAYSKAWGGGLMSGLENFELFLDPGNAVLLPPVSNEDHQRRWWVQEFSPRRGYVGALAAPWGTYRVRHWKWRPDEAGDSTQIDATDAQPFGSNSIEVK
ncbi:MAG: 4'-phosphopantetheinyl transferase superfamily protein [Gemmatimonadales bacterium]